MSKFHIVPWGLSKLSGRRIVMTDIPINSKLFATIPGSYFADAFEQHHSDIKGKSAVELYYEMFKKSPSWVETLLRVRNKTCKIVFGLKDVGTFTSFTLTKPETESVVVSTVVHVHNFIGKFYMFFVGPVHRVVACAMFFGLPIQNKKV